MIQSNSRHFVPNDGLFELQYPSECIYAISKGHIHDFLFVDGVGTFHLSVLGDKARNNLNRIKHNPKTKKIKLKSLDVYEVDLESPDDYSSIVWNFEISKILFLATYTYSKPKKNNDKFEREIKSIHKIITSILIVKESQRKQKLIGYKLGQFTAAIGAAETLLNRAVIGGCFIECVCLLASQIDAMLRIAIALHDQIENKNKEVDLTLIYQSTDDKPLFEKKIYSMSKDRKIIDQHIYDELFSAYNSRNRVVHRYIISDIRTVDILKLAELYSHIKRKIYDIVYALEAKQIELGLGMTVSGAQIPKNRSKRNKIEEYIQNAIREKHGGIQCLNKGKNKK